MTPDLAFDIAVRDTERQQRLINLGDGKTYRVRRRNFALDKQFEEMRIRMDALVEENEAIEAENERIRERNAGLPVDQRESLKPLKEDPVPYEDVCIALEDIESCESPPHAVLEELDHGWIDELRQLIWPERADALGKLLAAAAANTSQTDGGSTPTPEAPTSGD